MARLRVGDPAPDFSLLSGTGEQISLHDFLGTTVVLYFYPKDDTPSCTIEACGFRDASGPLAQAGAIVLGVSSDPPAAHQRFSRRYGLPFRLLSDQDGAVQRAYGVHRPILGRLPIVGRLLGPKRRTFLIDASGRIKALFPRVRADGHAREVLAVLRA